MTHTRTIVEHFRTFERERERERERRGGAVKRPGNANLTNRESRTKEIFLSLSNANTVCRVIYVIIVSKKNNKF